MEVLEDHGDWLYVSIPEHTGYVCADYMDVRSVPAEIQQDGSLSISLEPELIRQMLEQAEEEGAEVTSTDVGLTPEGNLTLVDDGHIYVGDQVMFGPNVIVATAGHPVDPELRSRGLQFNNDVRIGANAWIGAGAVIMPGVRIGANSVIGAGAVVTKDRTVSFTDAADVIFNPLDDYQRALIQRYCDTKDPYDKAGAYGIQNGGALLVQGIRGDFFSVVGLPVSRLARVISVVFDIP